MKRVLSDKIQKSEFFTYYIFMFLFGIFLTFYSWKVNFVVIIIPILSGAISILSLIIFFNLFKDILRVKHLLIPYIILLAVLFIISAIGEAVIFGFYWYSSVMKICLYFFCIFTPVKHVCLINTKLKMLKKR